LLADLSASLQELGADFPPTPTPVRCGSWVGGDRDGNPEVSAQVTDKVLRRYADAH